MEKLGRRVADADYAYGGMRHQRLRNQAGLALLETLNQQGRARAAATDQGDFDHVHERTVWRASSSSSCSGKVSMPPRPRVERAPQTAAVRRHSSGVSEFNHA